MREVSYGPLREQQMWTLVLVWLLGSTATSQTIPGFESEQVCGVAFNELKDKVDWGQGSKLIGKCISVKTSTQPKG